MDNLKELNIEELKGIVGGATFAYRVGQLIRFSYFNNLIGPEAAYSFVY